MVTEFVPQGEIDGHIVGIGGDGADLLLGIAHGPQVKLVGPLGQLGDAGEVEAVEGLCFGDHFQTLQICIVVGALALQADPLSLRPVLLRTDPVLLGEGNGLKQVQAPQIVHIFLGILRQLRHCNIGDQIADNGTLKGIVIQKYQRIHADIQHGLDVADVAGLVLPVGHEHGDVLQLEDHFRVVQEGFFGSGFIVFGADAKDDAPVFQFLQPQLEGREGVAQTQLADLDAVDAVVAHNTAPERVIQIQHDAFFKAAGSGQHRIGDLLGNMGQNVGAEGHFCDAVHFGIPHGGFTQTALETVDVHKEHVFVFRAAFRKQVIQLSQLEGKAVGSFAAEITEHPVVPGGEIELQYTGAHVGIDPLPHGHHTAAHGLGKLFPCFRREGAEAFIQLIGAVGQNAIVGSKGVKLRAGIHGLCIDLVVVGIQHLVADAGFIAPAPQGDGDVLGGAVAHDGHFAAGQGGHILLQILL